MRMDRRCDEPVISVSGLRKAYGDIAAVKDVSFTVSAGAFFAFLGPNGAGKSTTISILCTLVRADGGIVRIDGKDPQDPAVRREIGIVFQDQFLDALLTVRENLALRGAMYGIQGAELTQAVDDALAMTEATELADRRYGQLSGGQRRRAEIARALVHCPRILFLDEPTAGLDPQTRKHIWQTVGRLNRERGLTVFLTTHYIEEAAEADDVVVIDHGEVIAHGTPTGLRERYCRDRFVAICREPDTVITRFQAAGISCMRRGDRFTVELRRTADAVALVKLLDELIISFEVRSGTLEDAFLHITGEGME